MVRWLYIQLIWLHPAPFRWRFGDDMLDDFDRAPDGARPRYLADAVASLARQWLLRSSAWKIAAAVAGGALQITLGSVGRLLFEHTPTPLPGPRPAPVRSTRTGPPVCSTWNTPLSIRVTPVTRMA